MDPLKAYFLEHDGRISHDGDRMQAVAVACNTTPKYMVQIARGHKPRTAEMATSLQAATGISRRKLCPEFPWDEPRPINLRGALRQKKRAGLVKRPKPFPRRAVHKGKGR